LLFEIKFLAGQKAKAATLVYFKWQVVLLQGCSVATARLSRVLVKYSGSLGKSATTSQGKINLAGGGIFRLLVI